MKIAKESAAGAAFALALMTATPAFAADVGKASPSDSAAVAAKPADALSDMKVSRDKETGKLRAPTPEENAALDAKARSIAPNVVVLRRPVTTVEVRPNGSAVAKRSLDDMDNLVMERTADGKAVFKFTAKAAQDQDSSGLMELSLPAACVKPGEAVELRVVGSATRSRRWFGLFEVDELSP